MLRFRRVKQLLPVWFAVLLLAALGSASAQEHSILVVDGFGSIRGQVEGEAKIAILRRALGALIAKLIKAPEQSSTGARATRHWLWLPNVSCTQVLAMLKEEEHRESIPRDAAAVARDTKALPEPARARTQPPLDAAAGRLADLTQELGGLDRIQPMVRADAHRTRVQALAGGAGCHLCSFQRATRRNPRRLPTRSTTVTTASSRSSSSGMPCAARSRSRATTPARTLV